MSVKRQAIYVLLICGLIQPAIAASLATLFTTPEERELIDRNRYRETEIQPQQQPDETNTDIGVSNDKLTLEEVTREYRVTGITLSQEGPHMVWINAQVYEDGARLDDDSRIKVLTGDQVRVRITAPDGRQYVATSGETVEVSILVPMKVQP